jgi:hypothetical protein
VYSGKKEGKGKDNAEAQRARRFAEKRERKSTVKSNCATVASWHPDRVEIKRKERMVWPG